MVLPDGHDGGGGRGGAADCAEQQREGHRQAEDKDHREGDGGGRDERFREGDGDDLGPALFEGGELEVAPHAEGDEGERHVVDEVHVPDDGDRDQPERPGADQDARKDVAGDVGQSQPFGKTRDKKAREQHERQRENDLGGGADLFHPFEHGKPPFCAGMPLFFGRPIVAQTAAECNSLHKNKNDCPGPLWGT